MTRKLQFLFTALLLMVGVTSAWADDVTPKLDVCFRTNAATEQKAVNTEWVSGYPKKASTTNAESECNAQAGLFVLQKYTIADLDKVNKLVLRNVNSGNGGGDAIAIWVVAKATNYGNTSNFSTAWTENTAVADIVAAYTATTGIAPRATTGDVNTTYLVNGTSDRSDGNKFTISGDALTTLKNNAVDNTFTLLLTNKTGDMKASNGRKFCSSGSETNPLKLIASYSVQLETNSTTTYHETLNAAFDAIAASGTGTITLYGDATITSRCNVGAKTITVVPSKSGISITSSLTSSLWLLNNEADGNLTIGSDTYQLTIGGSSVVTNSSNFLETSTKACTTLLNNVKFKNLTTTNNGGVVNQKSSSSAVLTLKNCAFENCMAPTDRGVVFTGSDGALILSGNNTFTNCSTYDIYAEKRFKVDATNGVTNIIPIKVYSGIAVGSPVALTVAKEEIPLFKLMVDGKYLKWRTEGQTGDRRDMQVAEDASGFYNLTVTSAGAATLTLPYTTTIPSGAKCYTLSYTNGDDITASEITTTLPAHTPVLVVADAGNYTFTKTTAETPSANANLLMENYAANFVVPATTGTNDNYILSYKNSQLGFRKVDGSTNKVQPYRAYLSVKYDAGAGAREFFSIDFGDGETTAIDKVDVEKKMTGEVYNLQGVRMQGEKLPKGIYVRNGKKFVVK